MKMTSNEWFLLAAGVGLIFWLMKRDTSNTIKNLGTPINGVSEIFTGAKQGQAGYGWRYFTDGSAISPDGKYYLNGQYIWG